MKAHLFRTDSPLIPDRTVTAMCGATVANAREVYFQNLEFLSVAMVVPGMCKKCTAANQPDPRRLLLYAVCNNQELMITRRLQV